MKEADIIQAAKLIEVRTQIANMLANLEDSHIEISGIILSAGIRHWAPITLKPYVAQPLLEALRERITADLAALGVGAD